MPRRTQDDPHHHTAAPDSDDTRPALELSADENADLCSGCVKCCTYITVEIDPPRAAWEYDQWIWALHHRNVQLYVERPERWFLHFDTVCEQLNDQGRCSIYGRHPVLCRDYDPRSCERRLPLGGIRAWFKDAYEFEAWIRSERPLHWQRLMAHRKDTVPGPPVADAHADRRRRNGLVTIAGLTTPAAPPAYVARGRGAAGKAPPRRSR